MERQQVDVLIAPPFLTPSLQHDLSLNMSYEGSYALLYNYLGMPAGVVSTTRVRPKKRRAAAEAEIDPCRRPRRSTSKAPACRSASKSLLRPGVRTWY
ncbi:hypothetical protein [Paenibacillus cremeus]|nr:hypothetical protein [Paenibacillus cremeus]